MESPPPKKAKASSSSKAAGASSSSSPAKVKSPAKKAAAAGGNKKGKKGALSSAQDAEVDEVRRAAGYKASLSASSPSSLADPRPLSVFRSSDRSADVVRARLPAAKTNTSDGA